MIVGWLLITQVHGSRDLYSRPCWPAPCWPAPICLQCAGLCLIFVAPLSYNLSHVVQHSSETLYVHLTMFTGDVSASKYQFFLYSMPCEHCCSVHTTCVHGLWTRVVWTELKTSCYCRKWQLELCNKLSCAGAGFVRIDPLHFFGCHYQCNWLVVKTGLWNDLLGLYDRCD